MKRANSIKGRWWINGPDEPAVPGTLKVSPDSLRLDVWMPQVESVDNIITSLERRPKQPTPQVIHGLNEHNKPVTLFGCGLGSESRSTGLRRVKIHPLTAVRGLRVESWVEPIACAVKFQLIYLNRWFDRRLLAPITSADNESGFTHEKAMDIEHAVEDGVTIRFVNHTTYSQGDDEHRYSYDASIWLQFGKPRSLHEITNRWMPWVSVFLSVLVGRKMEIEQTFVFTSDPYIPGGGRLGRDGELLLKKGRNSKGKEDGPHSFDMLVSFRSIQHRLGEIVFEWKRIHKTFEPVIDLFNVVVLRRSLHSEAQFLFLVQAFEIYHASSKSFPSFDLPEAEKASRTAAVKASLSPELWAWVKGKIGLNSRSFAQKLFDVFDAHQKVSQRLLGNDLKEIASKIAYTRNYFTHHMATPDLARVIPEAELFKVSWGLEALLWIVLLRELKIEGGPIDSLARRVEDTRFVHLAS